ncbi:MULTISPECIES: hypothetical protein [Ureibacillus]|uniref:Uncharacterized protein n=2 Tax=Ureibacillus TaxID=160795 RepID=A0A0A3JQV4_9BACL|nr:MULTISPECIES: hypothetical protein [Ureibacillus]KGR89392.1 hypothetical protein CD30_17170 [Ureibacillus massiliensis 4400831 = CIP 108448 = CCUG 49529]MCM3390396.1 hypothetical protein [Ureibacillus chungkukjangi]PYF08567.1 hypothetical protein BJ095_102334 [Ureibacillus chungkukjangi]
MVPTLNELIISSHYSLLGSIPNKLRGLTVKLENETLYWKCYFDGEPTEEEKEILNVACTEVIADFPIIKDVKEEYLNYRHPLKMEMLQFWAYLRWEQN